MDINCVHIPTKSGITSFVGPSNISHGLNRLIVKKLMIKFRLETSVNCFRGKINPLAYSYHLATFKNITSIKV